MIAEWIESHFPPHRIYCEPFGGAASVLPRKPRSSTEVYNDLDGAIVTLFRVLRDPARSKELVRRVELTPFSRDEFYEAWDLGVAADDVDLAWRVLVKSWLAHGTTGATGKWKTGFRLSIKVRKSSPAGEWQRYPEALRAVIERLRGVYIENRPAVDVIRSADTPETLFYVDPPYPAAVRGRWDVGAYRHDLSADDHRVLAEVLRAAAGYVVLSSYRSPLYDDLYAGWPRRSKRVTADNGSIREECLWLSPRTAEESDLPLLKAMA